MEINEGPVLELRDLSKSFTEKKTGRPLEVLDGISIRIHPGSLSCIVGPSGCGKTTLLRLIGGLEMPTGGQVLFEGEPVSGPGPERGMIFQEYALFPWLTAVKNVSFGLEIEGLARQGAREKADEYLATVGLTGSQDLYPRELSGGMKQRVAIARTLAVEPRILLMDEPFASLDAQTRNGMQEFLVGLWRRTGTTIVFVTHSVDEAVFLGGDVIGLSRRPARVIDRFENALAYPRSRTDPGFVALRAGILEYLTREMADAPPGSDPPGAPESS
jgi:NitT/TauT family transport system ATP-binding protein